MKLLLAALAAAALGTACVGPGQNALAATPVATTPARPSEAPAASSSDKDREQLVKSNQDMETAREAHREAGQEQRTPAHAPLPGQPTPGTAPPAPTPAR